MILFDSNGNNVITDNKGIESKANYFSETIREYILFYITAKLEYLLNNKIFSSVFLVPTFNNQIYFLQVNLLPNRERSICCRS